MIDKILKYVDEISPSIEGKSNTNFSYELNLVINQARNYNHWFTEDTIKLRLSSIIRFIQSEYFQNIFIQSFNKSNITHVKYGFIANETIPLEEFTNLLYIVVTGNSFVYKTTEKSDKIIQLLFAELVRQISEFTKNIEFNSNPFKNVDSFIISKDTNNSILTEYFKNKESIYLAKGKAVALLSGMETREELQLLGTDIFNFFGQGAGNVRKLYVPNDYNFEKLFQAIEPWNKIMENTSWANNYQYNQSLYLFNLIKHFDNGFILLKDDKNFISPTGVVFYENYANINEIRQELQQNEKISYIYISSPSHNKENAFGNSANQLLIPTNDFINFINER